jgi:hypothetical protein
MPVSKDLAVFLVLEHVDELLVNQLDDLEHYSFEDVGSQASLKFIVNNQSD